MFELSIRVSNEEKSQTHKSIHYEEDILLSTSDPILIDLVEKATKEFNDPVDTVKLTITFMW